MMAPMRVTGIDHLVLTVASVPAAVDFYTRVLGLEAFAFDGGRVALRLGNQKLNLRPADGRLTPEAAAPTVGSADLCLVVDAPLDDVVAHLARTGTEIELGPVARSGARGSMHSVYLRDPDGNLVELASYDGQAGSPPTDPADAEGERA